MSISRNFCQPLGKDQFNMSLFCCRLQNRKLNNSINFDRYEYLRTTATELNDGGRHLMMKQRGFQLINPTEKWFPGLMDIRNNFSAWDWRYGKTPKFTVQKEIQLKSDDKDHNVQLKVSVDAVGCQVLPQTFFFERNSLNCCFFLLLQLSTGSHWGHHSIGTKLWCDSSRFNTQRQTIHGG